MSAFFPSKRARNIFDPGSEAPFKVSRSKIDLFIQCPRCFYLDRRLGIARPNIPPYTLNNAVDKLLKSEFDHYRREGKAHPLMKQNGIDAVPFDHPMLDTWRDALSGGIQFLHPATNMMVTGGIDDLWVSPEGDVFVVDYKATSRRAKITLDTPWYAAYKRQIEIYQWLFRHNGFQVADTGYFVFCNAQTGREFFESRLEFDLIVLPYKGYAAWIEQALLDLRACLTAAFPPGASENCEYCVYRHAAGVSEVF